MVKYDLLGIGTGPFNLSLNALSAKTKIKSVFLEKRENSSWHPGFLLDNCELQVSWVKDLVSTIDPTSQYSFLNFLVNKKEIYNFLSVRFESVPRKIFSDYYNWVSEALGNIHYNKSVELIDFDDSGLFSMSVSGEKFYAKNISIGIGREKNVPDMFSNYLNKDVFHSLDYLKNKEYFEPGNSVLVVGQGQSALETILDLLTNSNKELKKIIWVGRSEYLASLDDNPFIDNLYTPWFSDEFYYFNEEKKESIIKSMKNTSDGVSAKTAKDFAQLIVKSGLKDKIFMCNPSGMNGFKSAGNAYEIKINDKRIKVDKAILCTGSRQEFPFYMLSNKIKDMIIWENGRPKVNVNGKLEFTKREINIYLNGLLVNDFGLAEKNLATCAWRNAKIINEILDDEFYITKFNKLVNTIDELV